MNWKCYFGLHYFELIGIQPTLFESNFLYKCKNCCKYKVKEIKGRWKLNIDSQNDDDNDEDHRKPPILTPDDFYASLEK